MKDQQSIDVNEGNFEKWDRARTLLLESLLKPDNQLRSCAYNQGCKDFLLKLRDQVVDMVHQLENPYIHPEISGQKNRAKDVSINGVSVTLLGGALGEHYREGWSEEHLNEWREYSKGN